MSEMNLMLGDEIKTYVKMKLIQGYIVFMGDLDFLRYIEENVYKPGTDDNKLFEIILGPVGFALGMKTQKLQKILKLPDFDDTLLVICHSKIQNGDNISFKLEQKYRRPNMDFQKAVDITVNFVNWDNL